MIESQSDPIEAAVYGSLEPAQYDATQEAAGLSELDEYKRRLSGKDQALTRTRQAQQAAEARAAELEAKLAAAEAARTEAEGQWRVWHQQALRAQHPRAAALMPEGAMLDGAILGPIEARLAALEGAAGPEVEEWTPPTHANNARKAAPVARERSADEMMSELDHLIELESWRKPQ